MSFSKGDQVTYVPHHADGPNHLDANDGVVTEVGAVMVTVDYNDGSPNGKKTAPSQLVKRNPNMPPKQPPKQ